MSAGVAVITGTGSGMGRASAELFAARGWRVLGLDLTATPGADGITTAVVDITDRAAVEDALATHLAGSRIDAVLNIAGIYPPSTLETATTELYRRIFDVNVLGVLNVTAAASGFLGEGSAVVNVASVDGFFVSPGQLLYGASKAAVLMLTRSLALELATRGIRVNAIAPGWVDTPGNAATGRMAEVAASIPLGRVAQPAEIAEWTWLLATSGVASFMTGETVTLSGGAVIR